MGLDNNEYETEKVAYDLWDTENTGKEDNGAVVLESQEMTESEADRLNLGFIARREKRLWIMVQ